MTSALRFGGTVCSLHADLDGHLNTVLTKWSKGLKNPRSVQTLWSLNLAIDEELNDKLFLDHYIQERYGNPNMQILVLKHA